VRRLLLLPIHVALAAYCAGLCLAIWARPSPLVLLVPAGLCCLPVAVPYLRGAGWVGGVGLVVAVVLVMLAAGNLVGGARLDSLARSDLAPLTGSRVDIEATVVDLPKVKESRITLLLRVTAVDGTAVDEPARIGLDLPDEATLARVTDPCRGLTEGTRLRIARVRVRPLPAPTADGFDYGRYLQRRGEHVLLSGDYDQVTLAGRRGGFAGFTDGLRRRARASLRRGLAPPVREILQGMVLGDSEGFDQVLAEDFRRSGLMHIMAVSGENVVLVCALLGALLRTLGVGRRGRLLLLLPAVAVYVLLAGADPSIVRAGIAGGVVLLAGLLARPTDAPLLVFIPASVMLTLSPNTLFDVSFQLSFAAVLGLFVLAGRLTRSFGWLPGPLREQAGVTTAASLATAPVSLATFGQVSLVAVPANLVGGFVLGPVMLLGMLSVGLGFVSSAISVPLNVVAGVLIAFLVQVARLFAAMPGATYAWHGITLGFVFSLLLLAAVVVLPWLAARRQLGVVRYIFAAGRAPVVALLLAVPVALALILTPSAPAGPTVPTVTFLDVGQGTAVLVQAPGSGTVLVDTGPGPIADDLWRHGVRRIELLVISHSHDDHIGGLAEIVGETPIDLAVLPRPPTPDPALEGVAQRLRAAGVRVVRCTEPRMCRFGPLTLHMTHAWAVSSTGNQAENDNGVVVMVESPAGSVLLPGDAEAEALTQLGLPACDVIAAPHHGSAGGFTADLLTALDPDLAVIPVGADNRHGHPDAETLALAAAAGLPVLRTDRHGDITVTLDGADPTVSVENAE